MKDAGDMQARFWSPLTQVWTQRIHAAQRARSRFDKIARQCNAYYQGTAGFMWSEKHKQDFFDGNLPDPKFKITLNKMYEYVSLYAPSLFWQYPHRKVMSQRMLDLSAEMFGDTNDPYVQQIFQQFAEQDAEQRAAAKFANREMEIYLNWAQREAELLTNSQHMIHDALLTGAGCLWPETYSFPGSDHVYTRLQFDSINNLYVDADCRDPEWNSAGYIMRRHCMPVWQVERIFGLKPGRLRGKGSRMSAEMSVRQDFSDQPKDTPDANDLIDWYEIWSKIGIGPHLNGTEHSLLDEFDEVLGDFAYLCIAPEVNFVLNAPPEKFYGRNAWKPDDVRDAFEWRSANYGHPFPVFRDNRWPVAFLKFNPVRGSAWPMAPGGPALGYLITLNILMSAYVDQAWTNRKQIIGYIESEQDKVQTAINSDDPVVSIPLNDHLNKSISDIISTLPPINSNGDLLQAIAMVADGFDKNIGLNELMYGHEGSTQVRVAQDIRERSARSSIRPDKMGDDVATTITKGSQLELILAAMHVKGSSLTHLLGEAGATFWDNYFREMPIEQLMREMSATVEASEVRRPNRERDTANVQSLQQYMLPILQQHFMQSNDPKPLNGLLKAIGTATELDVSAFLLPETDPEQQQQQQAVQQAMQQLEMQKTQAETESKKADAQSKQAAAQKHLADAAKSQRESVVNESEVSELEHEQELRHREEEHEQKILHAQEDHVQKLLFDTSELMLAVQEHDQQMGMKAEGHKQDLQASKDKAKATKQGSTK